MRTRIALSTALAVLVVVPVLLFAFFSSSPAASARARLEAGSRHRAARIDMRLMSYAQAQKVARLATFYNGLTAQAEATYLKEIAYLQALAAQQKAAAAAAAAAAVVASRTAVASLPVPVVNGSDASSTGTADWACIRQHESGDDYGAGGGGAYQFELGTWEGLTGLSSPAEDAPPAVQDAAALKLYAQRGWEPWTTRYVCGL